MAHRAKAPCKGVVQYKGVANPAPARMFVCQGQLPPVQVIGRLIACPRPRLCRALRGHGPNCPLHATRPPLWHIGLQCGQPTFNRKRGFLKTCCAAESHACASSSTRATHLSAAADPPISCENPAMYNLASKPSMRGKQRSQQCEAETSLPEHQMRWRVELRLGDNEWRRSVKEQHVSTMQRAPSLNTIAHA